MRSTLKTEVKKPRGGLGKIGREISGEIERIQIDTANVTASIESQLVPVATGNLKSTIAVEIEER